MSLGACGLVAGLGNFDDGEGAGRRDATVDVATGNAPKSPDAEMYEVVDGSAFDAHSDAPGPLPDGSPAEAAPCNNTGTACLGNCCAGLMCRSEQRCGLCSPTDGGCDAQADCCDGGSLTCYGDHVCRNSTCKQGGSNCGKGGSFDPCCVGFACDNNQCNPCRPAGTSCMMDPDLCCSKQCGGNGKCL